MEQFGLVFIPTSGHTDSEGQLCVWQCGWEYTRGTFYASKREREKGETFRIRVSELIKPEFAFSNISERERERERCSAVQSSAGVIPNDVVMTAFTTNKSNLKIRNQD